MPPVPPQGGSSLGKITFTHKVLMCLCEHVCVCVRRQKRKGDRQREICLIKEAKQAQTRNRQWQDWKLGALGGHQRLYKWMCVCV